MADLPTPGERRASGTGGGMAGVPARLRCTGSLVDGARAGTAPNSPGITPKGTHTSAGGGASGPGCNASHSCQQSPMRSPRSHSFAISPVQRGDRWLGVTDREDFANTMSAMRESCEQRRVAKQRADNELRVLQRELPLDMALSAADREQISSLIDRFTFLALGSLSRAVCQALVAELQELRMRTLSPLVTRLLFSISPVLRRTLTDSELSLMPMQKTMPLQLMHERQESSFLGELRSAKEIDREWDTIRRRRASQTGHLPTSPPAAAGAPAAEGRARLGRAAGEGASSDEEEAQRSRGGAPRRATPASAPAPLARAAARTASPGVVGVESLMCRVCEQPVCSAEMEDHMTMCMLDMMVVVSARRLRRVLKTIESHVRRIERASCRATTGAACSGGGAGCLAAAPAGAPAAGAAAAAGGSAAAVERPDPDAQLCAPLPLLASCADCCHRALELLNRADGSQPRQAGAEETIALVQAQFAKLERLGQQSVPNALMRIVLEATEASTEGAQLAELAGQFFDVFQQAAKGGSRLRRTLSLGDLHDGSGGLPVISPPASAAPGAGAHAPAPAPAQALPARDGGGGKGPSCTAARSIFRAAADAADGRGGGGAGGCGSDGEISEHSGPLFTQSTSNALFSRAGSVRSRAPSGLRPSATARPRSGRDSPVGRTASPLSAAAPPVGSRTESPARSDDSPLCAPPPVQPAGDARSRLLLAGPPRPVPSGGGSSASVGSGGGGGGGGLGGLARLGSSSGGLPRRLLERRGDGRSAVSISIDSFQMIKPISRGAYGRVFLAMKRKTGDLYAVKVLSKADTLRKNQLANVTAEQSILAQANNPFVVKLFYSFASKRYLYLVMEFVNGGDLYSLLQTVGRLEERTACAYVAELCLALQYLHDELGVVHRDLKPDNALIDSAGHIVLTDFGLSHMGVGDALAAPGNGQHREGAPRAAADDGRAGGAPAPAPALLLPSSALDAAAAVTARGAGPAAGGAAGTSAVPDGPHAAAPAGAPPPLPPPPSAAGRDAPSPPRPAAAGRDACGGGDADAQRGGGREASTAGNTAALVARLALSAPLGSPLGTRGSSRDGSPAVGSPTGHGSPLASVAGGACSPCGGGSSAGLGTPTGPGTPRGSICPSPRGDSPLPGDEAHGGPSLPPWAGAPPQCASSAAGSAANSAGVRSRRDSVDAAQLLGLQQAGGRVGTPDYMSPEILLGTGHDARVDWWSLGVVLFELVVGVTPFNAESAQGVFDNILRGNIQWPPHAEQTLSAEVRSLIVGLLTPDPDQRLGAKGAEEVKAHPFFRNINWQSLVRRERSQAPFVPQLEHLYDTSYFKERLRKHTSAQHTASMDKGALDFRLADSPAAAAAAAPRAPAAQPAAQPAAPDAGPGAPLGGDEDGAEPGEMPGFAALRKGQKSFTHDAHDADSAGSANSSEDDGGGRGARAGGGAGALGAAEGRPEQSEQGAEAEQLFSQFSTFVHLGNLQQMTRLKLTELKQRLGDTSPREWMSDCSSLPCSTSTSPVLSRFSAGPSMATSPSSGAAGSRMGARTPSSMTRPASGDRLAAWAIMAPLRLNAGAPGSGSSNAGGRTQPKGRSQSLTPL